MEPRCVAGSIWRPERGFEDGWLLHDGARILDAGEGRPPQRPLQTGIVLPGLVDAHTHVGDRVGRGTPLAGLSLAQVVAPPDGLKHRLLRETPPERLLEGMRAAVAELQRSGAYGFADFREGGVEGAMLLRRALEGSPLRPRILGRCKGAFDEEEARAVLDATHGYGFSGLGDVKDDAPERASALCRRMGKTFALHLSEDRREDVGRALDLRPTFLVHCVHATKDDLDAIAQARVPVVTCPRSNALFGGRADVPAMLDAGIVVALGSDNAMFHPLDVLAEARLLARTWPKLDRERILAMAVVAGRRALFGRAAKGHLEPGDEASLLVLPQRGEPLDDIFGGTA